MECVYVVDARCKHEVYVVQNIVNEIYHKYFFFYIFGYINFVRHN